MNLHNVHVYWQVVFHAVYYESCVIQLTVNLCIFCLTPLKCRVTGLLSSGKFTDSRKGRTNTSVHDCLREKY